MFKGRGVLGAVGTLKTKSLHFNFSKSGTVYNTSLVSTAPGFWNVRPRLLVNFKLYSI